MNAWLGPAAEATGVASGCVVQASNLSSSFCEVAAAALVHIAAGFLTAVDDVVDLVLIDTGYADQVQQGQDSGSLVTMFSSMV